MHIMQPLGGYVYPGYSLHITAGAPAPFTTSPLGAAGTPPAARAAYTATWLDALAGAATREAGWPTAPFPLVYRALVLDASAGYFAIDDPSGGVAAVRACLHRAAAAVAAAGGDPSPSTAGFKTPGIVHSTVLRWARAPPLAAAAAIRAAWEAIAADWRPVTVMVRAAVVVHERRAYMHLHLDGADADAVLAVLPFE